MRKPGRTHAGRRAAILRASAHLDKAWLRDLVETLCPIHRPTASPGERGAAAWLLAKLRDQAPAARSSSRRHTARSGGRSASRPRPALLAGIAALRGHRVLGRGARRRPIGAAALDDLPPGERRFRRLLPQKTATTVVTEMGPADAKRTVVLVAHHDAAHSGLIYHPAIPELVFGRAPWLLERNDTSPPLMAPAVAIPRADRRRRARAGTGRSSRRDGGRRRRRPPLLADIGSRETVTGRQRQRHRRGAADGDGAGAGGAADGERSGDACLDLGGGAVRGNAGLRRGATSPSSRARARSSSPLDTLGSPHLLVLRGEGMIRMREYPARSLARPRRPRRGARDRPVPEPAPAQRDRRHLPARRRLRVRLALLVHRPQAAGELPLAHRRARERRLRDGRRRRQAHGGPGPPPGRALALAARRRL